MKTRIILFLLAVVPHACLQGGEQQDIAVDKVERAILNGHEYDDDPTYFREVVQKLRPVKILLHLTGKTSTCSGTLLNNKVVITARHCLADLSNMEVILEEIDAAYVLHTQSRNVSVAHRKPGSTLYTDDLALLVLEAPFIIDGETTGYRMPIYPGADQGLVGEIVLCAGYGRNTAVGGAGTLRWAEIELAAMDPDDADEGSYAEVGMLKAFRNDSDQFLYSGDSGASCFYNLNGVWFLATVHNASKKLPRFEPYASFGIENSPTNIRQWASPIIDEMIDVYSDTNFSVDIEPVGSSEYVVKFGNVYHLVDDPEATDTAVAFAGSARFAAGSEATPWDIVWMLYEVDAQTGSLSLIAEEPAVDHVVDPAVDIPEHVFIIASTGTYRVEAVARHDNGQQISEARDGSTIKIVPSTTTNPDIEIEIVGHATGGPATFGVGEPIEVHASIRSEVGIYSLGLVVEEMVEDGSYTEVKETGFSVQPQGVASFQHQWRFDLKRAGSYRIYAFAQDALYFENPQRQTFYRGNAIEIPYGTVIRLSRHDGQQTASYLFDDPIAFEVSLEDPDGIVAAWWYVMKWNEDTGTYQTSIMPQFRVIGGETAAVLQEEITLSEPGTYEIRAFSRDVDNNNNPTVSQSLQIVDSQTRITVPGGEEGEKRRIVYIEDATVDFDISAADKDGLIALWWWVQRRDKTTGALQTYFPHQLRSAGGNQSAGFQESFTFTELGTYRLNTFSKDINLDWNSTDYHVVEVRGHETKLTVAGTPGRETSVAANTPVAFEITAKDMDGISRVGWYVTWLNPATEKWENFIPSHLLDKDGSTMVTVSDELVLTEPTTYNLFVEVSDNNSEHPEFDSNPRVGHRIVVTAESE